MRLRIARKLGRRTRSWPKFWWLVYSDDQLRRAVQRLKASWSRRNKSVDGMINVRNTDYFAMNRVESKLIRQPLCKQRIRSAP